MLKNFIIYIVSTIVHLPIILYVIFSFAYVLFWIVDNEPGLIVTILAAVIWCLLFFYILDSKICKKLGEIEDKAVKYLKEKL